ncbi:MAG: serine hydrolase domain-containing protein [Acidobacteriota bacterium]
MKGIRSGGWSIITWIAVAALTAGVAAQGLPSATPEAVGFAPGRLERIDRVMQDYVERGIFPGMTVAVVRHGKLVYRRSFGFSDVASREPVREDTIFRIYSMSKPVTSVAALMLFEQGYYLLDDPVSKYLPELKGLKIFGQENAPPPEEGGPREMTIRDLFRHTSGLGYGWGQGPVDAIYRNLNLLDRTRTLAEAVAKLAEAPLYFAPGTAWQYSVSIDVLGRLVEVLSGKTLEEFLQERIFVPLGMPDTGFFITPEKQHRLTSLYNFNQETQQLALIPPERSLSPYQREHSRLLSGGGGLLSTTDDYLRFATMLANRGSLGDVRLLAPETVKLMGTDHLPDGVTMPWPKLAGHGYGLGVSVLTDVAKSMTYGSPGDFGWDGAASTYFRVDPAKDLVILLMTHRMPCDTEIQVKLKTLVYQALVEPEK